MAHKRITTLIVLLLIVVVYSVVSLHMDDGSLEYNTIFDSPPSDFDENSASRLSRNQATKELNARQSSAQQANIPVPVVKKPSNGFPISFLVVGISVDSENTLDSRALLRLPEGLNEFGESDTIDNTDIKVLKIKENTVDFIYEGKTLSVSLTPPNLLATDYKETEKSYSEYLAMTPEEIGSRPRVIEHIVTLTPTPYIADGKLASIGINPALFDQAGLQEDDVVKTINGKSITVESEFDELKQEIPQATTLTFLVMRRGRLITLYLDIPSEGLTVTP